MNFRGGNWDFTIAHLSGAQIDTAGSPCVVVGDRVVVVDPSAFAAEQAALGGVVNAANGIVANRLGGVTGAGGGGADLALPGAVEPRGGWNFWAEGFAGRASEAADGALVASQNPSAAGRSASTPTPATSASASMAGRASTMRSTGRWTSSVVSRARPGSTAAARSAPARA